jgi:hypothetical protein
MPAHPSLDPDAGRHGRARRDRAIAIGVSLCAHALILAAILFAKVQSPPDVVDNQPVTVALMAPDRPVDLDHPIDAPAAKPKPTPPAVRRDVVRRTPPHPTPIPPLHAATGPTHETVAQLSDADIAGAATAGSGDGGGGGSGGGGTRCDMIRRLQGALRRDPLVQAAAVNARRAGETGKAILVWNGDWVRNISEDGKGLAAVREAILWEVGFAPEACRAQPMRGLVLLSLDDGPGSARLVLGSRAWRWSDLLTAR